MFTVGKKNKDGLIGRFLDHSDSDSEEETDFLLRREPIVAKKRDVHLRKVPPEKDGAARIYKQSSFSSTPRAVNRPVHIDLNSSNPSSRTVTPLTHNLPSDDSVESVDYSTGFFTPA